MVARAAERDVGRCGPLSNAFNATRDAACRAFVLPAVTAPSLPSASNLLPPSSNRIQSVVLQNGYWVSVCWCALLMPVVLCVSARLARLYRRAEPYPGPLVEAYVTPCSSFPLPSVSALLRIGTRLVNIAVRLTHTAEVPMRRVGAGLRWRRPRPASRLFIF